MSHGNIDHEKIHLNLARLTKNGNHFEISVDPDLALSFKKGQDISMHEIMKSEHIFSDAKNGLLASEEQLTEVFGTHNPLEVAKIIINKGEIQLTSEYRNKLIEDKKKQIINTIHKNACDPSTGLPHPITRIENAMVEAKIHIDEHKSAKEQIGDIIKKLRPIIPISMELKKIELTVPAEFTGKAYSLIQGFSKMKDEKWNADGSLTVIIEVTAARQQELFDKLNSMTHGNIESKNL